MEPSTNPKCPPWPKCGRPRTLGRAWPIGYQFGTPYPKFYELGWTAESGTVDPKWKEVGVAELGLAGNDFVYFGMEFVTHGNYFRSLWWDTFVDPIAGDSWRFNQHNPPSMPGITVRTNQQTAFWPNNPTPFDFAARITTWRFNLLFPGGGNDWIEYAMKPRPDDWVP